MRKFIKLTDEQLQELEEVFVARENLGAIMAQIFRDGMHVILLTEDEAYELQKKSAELGISRQGSVHYSAEMAYVDGLERDK